MTNTTFAHSNNLGSFQVSRNTYLDVNGNPIYTIARIGSSDKLPKIPGYRRTQGMTAYTTQSYNIEMDLQHFDTVVSKLPMYTILDALDSEDEGEPNHTFQSLKQWLTDFWIDNPNEDDEEEEQQEHLDNIQVADIDTLSSMFEGVGYIFEEMEVNK